MASGLADILCHCQLRKLHLVTSRRLPHQMAATPGKHLQRASVRLHDAIMQDVPSCSIVSSLHMQVASVNEHPDLEKADTKQETCIVTIFGQMYMSNRNRRSDVFTMMRCWNWERKLTAHSGTAAIAAAGDWGASTAWIVSAPMVRTSVAPRRSIVNGRCMMRIDSPLFGGERQRSVGRWLRERLIL